MGYDMLGCRWGFHGIPEKSLDIIGFNAHMVYKHDSGNLPVYFWIIGYISITRDI
jgi:hypothetical protein